MFFFITSILRYAVIVLYLLIEYLVQVKAQIISFLVMFEKERLVEQKIQTVNEDNQRYLKIPHLFTTAYFRFFTCEQYIGQSPQPSNTHEVLYSLILPSSCSCISINKTQKTYYIPYLHLRKIV